MNIKHFALISLVLLVLTSCDKEYASIDTDIINNENADNFSTDNLDYPVITYTKNYSPFSASQLSSNILGYYNHSIFGNSTANVIAQVNTNRLDPIFGDNVELDSVVLTIPYFSNVNEVVDGVSGYKLDSVYGNTPIKLSIYKNNYYLRDFDPDQSFDTAQKYFSNGTSSSSDAINISDLEAQLLFQDDDFLPSADEIKLTQVELDENGDPVLDDENNPVTTITARQSPAIRVHLDNPNGTFWQDLIFNKEGQPELSNQNNFTNHFRGLYLKAEAIDDDGTMMLLNLSTTASSLTLYYTSDIEGTDDTGTDTESETEAGEFVMNFSGNNVSLYNNNFITISWCRRRWSC